LPEELVRKLSLLLFDKRNRATLIAARSERDPGAAASKPLINAVQEARIAAMPFDILCFLGDREEMAHSLEARLPFLDHKLYDMAKGIPADLKIGGGMEKAVLRDAAQGILPEELRLRRKSGFMLTSEAVDLFGADREHARRLRAFLSREAFAEAGLFSYPAFAVLSWLARLPRWGRLLRRLRRNSNKVILYMMQAHMLHRMFVAEPRWRSGGTATPVPQSAEPAPEFAD
jgi:asparagine synthetase B (glutamine-hydrolysing)